MRDVPRELLKVLWRGDGLEEDPDYDGWTILDNIYGPNLFLCF